MTEPTYPAPTPYDYRNSNGVHRIVVFQRGVPRFSIGNRRYKICSTTVFPDDVRHIIENVDTGESREVSAKQIRMWIDEQREPGDAAARG